MNNMKPVVHEKHLKEHQDYLKTIGRMAVADKKAACNIIMILMDDLGWGDLSCFGSEAIHTPHLDRLTIAASCRLVMKLKQMKKAARLASFSFSVSRIPIDAILLRWLLTASWRMS